MLPEVVVAIIDVNVELVDCVLELTVEVGVFVCVVVEISVVVVCG
jgi:hypothetical protein